VILVSKRALPQDPEAGSRMFYGAMWLWPASIEVSKWTLFRTFWYWLTVE